MKYIFALLLLAALASTAHAQTAVVSGYLQQHSNNDTVKIQLFGYDAHAPYSYERALPGKTFTQVTTNGSFRFQIPVEQAFAYFSLSASGINGPLTRSTQCLAEKNDSIHCLVITNDSLQFSGRGSAKAECNYLLDKRIWKDKNSPRPRWGLTSDSLLITRTIDAYDSTLRYGCRILEGYTGKISPQAQALIRLDLEANMRFQQYDAGAYYFFMIDTALSKKMMQLYKHKLLQQPLFVPAYATPELQALSRGYAEYVMKKLLSDYKYNAGLQWAALGFGNTNLSGLLRKQRPVYTMLRQQFSGVLREKLLTLFTYESLSRATQEDLDYYIHDAAALVTTPPFTRLIADSVARFATGTKLVNFELTDSTGRTITQADCSGKVVLIDIWYTGCGACQSVAAAMPEVEEKLKGYKDVLLLSVSIDKDRNTWLHSIRKNAKREKQYPFAGKHYAGDSTIYLYTGGKGDNVELIKNYVTRGYPTLLLFTKNGKLFSGNATRPDGDRANLTVKDIDNALQDNR